MYRLGEYNIIGKFPINIKSFSITFYGAHGKGNIYVNLYKSDGSLLSSHVLKNAQNGPYGFMSSEYNIAGFSVYNNDVGGLSIYEIRYGDEEMIELPVYFLDTFTGTGDLSHTTDSGHDWIVPSWVVNPEEIPSTNWLLDSNGYVLNPTTNYMHVLQANWTPSTTTWYLEVDIYIAAHTPFEEIEFEMTELDDANYYGPKVSLSSGSTYTYFYFSSDDENFTHYIDEPSLISSDTEFTLRIEVINNARIRILLDSNIIFDTDTASPSGDLSYPNTIERAIMKTTATTTSSWFKINRFEASDFSL